MNFGEFREMTKNIADDVEIIIDAKSNPCGNCWDCLHLEATTVSFFGVQSPAIKILTEEPKNTQHYYDKNGVWVHQTHGSWIDDIPLDKNTPE